VGGQESYEAGTGSELRDHRSVTVLKVPTQSTSPARAARCPQEAAERHLANLGALPYTPAIPAIEYRQYRQYRQSMHGPYDCRRLHRVEGRVDGGTPVQST